MRHRHAILLFAGCLSLGAVAQADDPSLLTCGFGCFGIKKEHRDPLAVVEWRPALRYYGVGAWLGLEWTSRTVYAGGGLRYDIPLGGSWRLTPSVGVGRYDVDHTGMDLGSLLQFRSQLELSYCFPGGTRIGAGVSHLSNASTSRDNPGTETAVLLLSLPLGPRTREPLAERTALRFVGNSPLW